MCLFGINVVCSPVCVSRKWLGSKKAAEAEWKFVFALISTRQFAQWLKTSLSAREDLDSIPGLVKSNAVSPTARHRCDVSSELCCPDAKPRRWIPPLVTRFSVISRWYWGFALVISVTFYIFVSASRHSWTVTATTSHQERDRTDIFDPTEKVRSWTRTN